MLEKKIPQIRVTGDSTQSTFRGRHNRLCLKGSYPAADVAKDYVGGLPQRALENM